MAGKYSVGKSSYGDLRGVEQFVSTARIALQVLSVIADFNDWMRTRGRTGRLSVNEASRSRARQSLLWANRFVLGVTVAPPFTSRHDEVLHGNAIDFGITDADGSNRALTADEFAKLHELVEARGGTWTGVNFGEPWHHEMATQAERVAPYTDAAERAAGIPPAAPHPDDNPRINEQEDDDMARITWADNQPTLWVGTGSWDMTNLTVSGKKYTLPVVLGYVRRWMRADQTKDYPEKFNKQEHAIIRAALKKVK